MATDPQRLCSSLMSARNWTDVKHRLLKPGTGTWSAQVSLISERLSLMTRYVNIEKESHAQPLKYKVNTFDLFIYLIIMQT